MVNGDMLFWILVLTILFLIILYIVIMKAVQEGIDRSEVGQLLLNKYGVKEEVTAVSDEEIEKELEDGFK